MKRAFEDDAEALAIQCHLTGMATDIHDQP